MLRVDTSMSDMEKTSTLILSSSDREIPSSQPRGDTMAQMMDDAQRFIFNETHCVSEASYEHMNLHGLIERFPLSLLEFQVAKCKLGEGVTCASQAEVDAFFETHQLVIYSPILNVQVGNMTDPYSYFHSYPILKSIWEHKEA